MGPTRRPALRPAHPPATADPPPLHPRRQGRPFPPGHNPAIAHVAFTREPLRCTHRLLAYYVMVKAFQMLGHGIFRLRGHRRHVTKRGVGAGLTYWHRPCQQQGRAVKQPPLLFFHGISPGLWFYIPFLSRLGKGREVIMLEVPHIVTQLAFEAPNSQVRKRGGGGGLGQEDIEPARRPCPACLPEDDEAAAAPPPHNRSIDRGTSRRGGSSCLVPIHSHPRPSWPRSRLHRCRVRVFFVRACRQA